MSPPDRAPESTAPVLPGGLAGLGSDAALKAHLLAHGPYDAAENLRIYEQYFTRRRPREKLFHYLNAKLRLTDRPMADVGCGFGTVLAYCPPGSYGLELQDYYVKFLRAVGLPVFEKNLITDDLAELPKVDAIWCAATLEHVDAPHIFLRRLYYLLKPGGRLVLEVPCAIPAGWMRRLPGAAHVYGDHDDHVNSFSPTTLHRTCERAGFDAEWVFRYSTPLLNRKFPVWLTGLPPFRAVANSLVYVGRQIPDWEYGKKSTRRAENNLRGYKFQGWFPDGKASY